ncbi:MAG TPA: glycosyltransferase, partial [Acidimicrobiales bacterium]|nr:glycosyltransferase [Acidimicrobiales bacterium]
MRSLAVLSMHTSPLAQPGTGDSGGMNVYVRQLSAALARAGVSCEVFTRAWDPSQPKFVQVEPGFRVHHVQAGPLAPLAKEALPDLVDSFTEGVAVRLAELADRGAEIDAIHANYWLSGIAGHTLKHELGVPLVSTFHTLDRVKAEASPE